jgi:cupin fold WbuC family metalloprotein
VTSFQFTSFPKLNLKIEQPGVFYAPSLSCIDTELYVRFLHKICTEQALNTARICFHRDHHSPLMSMLILNTEFHSYPIHRHVHKFESYTILEGSCKFESFDTNGNLLTSSLMSKGDFLMNESRNFHVIRPLTPSLAFIEHTMGPFKQDSNDYLA